MPSIGGPGDLDMDLEIRTARPPDRDSILGVVQAAFSNGDGDGREELDIVEAVSKLGAVARGLELVATVDRVVIGYVLGSWGALGRRPVVGVAPLAVMPHFQGLGVGSALMLELIDRADASGLDMVLVLGDPAYYERFGFEPAGPMGVHPLSGAESRYFQMRRLSAYTDDLRGSFAYSWET